MATIFRAEFTKGCVVGIEYFSEEETNHFTIFIHLLFIRIAIFFNAEIGAIDHHDLGDTT